MTRTFPSASFNGPYFGKVTASEYVDPEDTSTKRWKYTLEIVELAENGWEGFDAPAELDEVLNVFESGNTSSASMGVDHASLPGSYELQPCPNDTVVLLWSHPVGHVMAWPNQFDGDC